MPNFIIGDSRSGSGTVSQVGSVNFTAKLTVDNGYNPITEENEVIVYNLVAGQSTSVDVTTSSKLKLECNPKSGYTISSANYGYRGQKSITVSNGVINHEYSFVANQNVDYYLQVQVTTTTAPANKNFVFGNNENGGKPYLDGENPFTGVLTLLGEYDPATEEYEQIIQNVVSGTDITLRLSKSFTKGTLVLDVVEGYEFTGTKFPSEAPFTNTKIEYSITSTDLSSDSLYFTAYTKKANEPQPNDKPETILNNYYLSKDELDEFKKLVYEVIAQESLNNNTTPITDYISEILIYPFIIPEYALYGRQKIKVRDKTFNIANQILKDTVKLDLGYVEVEAIHKNSLDYLNVNCDIYLPFISGSINLNPEMVVGKKVGINYNINISDGSTTVNIFDYDTKEIFNISKANIGSTQPFYNYNRVLNKEYSPSQAINEISSPYIKVEMPDYSQTKPKTIIESYLKDVKGFVTITDLQINLGSLSSEKDELVSILSQGVLIK